MCGHRGALRELAVTDLAAEGLLARVRAQVRGQVGRLRERLAAAVAFVRFLALSKLIQKQIRLCKYQ